MALPPFEPPPRHERPDAADDAPDVWDEALELVAAGRATEGIQLHPPRHERRRDRPRAVPPQAPAGRALPDGQPPPGRAAPARKTWPARSTSIRLEQWEDEQLSARVWGALYRCLRASGADVGAAERLQQVFTRLCRLDIDQAMMFGDEGAQGRSRPRCPEPIRSVGVGIAEDD